MSEIFIRQLANRITRHPDFQRAMEVAVGSVLQTVLSTDFKGEQVSLYGAARPASFRRERDSLIRKEWTGSNTKELATKHSMSPRHVMRVIKGK
jgi:Mor family transcriptional regulator